MKRFLRCVTSSVCALALAASGTVFAGGAGGEPGKTSSQAAAPGESPQNRRVETVRQTRFRHRGVTVSGGYIHHAGRYPYFGYRYPYGYYDAFFPPFYHPAYFAGFSRGPRMGTVKLNSADKSVQVYIDGGYAGTARDLKSIPLGPGAYDLELRNADGYIFKRRIYVLTGKTVRVMPEFRMEHDPPIEESVPEERP